MNVSQETIDAIEEAAKEATGWPDHCRKWEARNKANVFRSLFGCSSTIAAELWERIVDIDDDEEKTVDEMRATHKHLLYALLFLKVYGPNEIVHCAIFGYPDEETFRKYQWYFVKKIAHLQHGVIRFEDRFAGQEDLDDIQNDCMMSIDCLDCPCYEPGKTFDTQMYSKKHNGPGIKYEVGVCIRTGHIVWIKGPFKAGELNDLGVFESELEGKLCVWEMVEVDSGYLGNFKCKVPAQGIDTQERKDKLVVRARHEVVNGRLRIFGAITNTFHHCQGGIDDMIEKHGYCFAAVAVITQLKLASGETETFHVPKYNAKYS